MMAKFLPVAMLVLLTAAGPSGFGRTDPGPTDIVLKDKATVRNSVIELADVAVLGEDVPPGVARLLLGNAPWPGRVREISRVLIKVRLVSTGFDLSGFRFAGSDVCPVELESVSIDPQEIVAAARSHLESFFPQGGPEVHIELVRGVAPVQVAAGDALPELRPVVAGQGVPIGNVRVDVDVVRDGTRLKRVPASFSVRLRQKVAVARQKVAPGDRFTSLNTTLAVRDVTAVRGACALSLEELQGKVAAQSVQPGQIIARRLIREGEPPVVIEAHQRVFLVVVTNSLRVTTVGKALCRARKGEVARAENLTTGREVVGVAVADNIIQIPMGEPSDAD